MQLISDIKNYFQVLANLTAKKTHPHTIALLRGAVSLWVIIGTVILIPAASQFYSMASHIPLGDTANLGPFWMLHLLDFPKYNFLYPTFIVAQLVFAVLAGLSVAPRLTSSLLYFFTISLDNRAYVILDGGNNLMHLILFYLIFISPRQNKESMSFISTADNLFSNLGLYMCRIQVVLVYATAGLLKVTGPLWTKGVALYYTMSVIEFGRPTIAHMMSHVPLIMVVATYGTLLFQITFPFMIWNRKARPLYMAMGTLLHLQISLVMGLFTFGLAMCTSYFSFYTDDQARIFLNRLSSIKNKSLEICRKIPAYAQS